MGILGWILLGIVGGVIAKALLPGEDPGGFIVTVIVGIVGALLGGFLARALGFGDPIDEFFDVSTWLDGDPAGQSAILRQRSASAVSRPGVRIQATADRAGL